VTSLRSAKLIINDGAAYTNDQTVRLKIEAQNPMEMYITNEPTCSSGGEWEKFSPTRLWQLGQSNNLAPVYAKIRNDLGMTGECISASIVHDSIAPSIEVTDSPLPLSAVSQAKVGFESRDAGSGVERLECRIGGKGEFNLCQSPLEMAQVAEGPNEVWVRSIDRAGNVSPAVSAQFVADRTPPTVSFLSTPQALSNSSTAVFTFEAIDNITAKPRTYCRLDTNGVAGAVMDNCPTPRAISDLGAMDVATQYRFWIWATDEAGNESSRVSYAFTVDKAPSGMFQILGVAGGTDESVDNWLGTVPNPTVYWTPSDGATLYRVSILNLSGQTVCAEVGVPAANTHYMFSAEACSLADGQSYRARVAAENAVGNLRVADLYQFGVDLVGPNIQIIGPTLSNDTKDANFKLSVTDRSGVKTTVCYKGTPGQANEQLSNCLNVNDVNYTNLGQGDHTFRVSAQDLAGNTSATNLITWKVVPVVCDPFSNNLGICKRGLRAHLWYLNSQQRSNPPQAVADYISMGTKANVLIYLSQLFIPTRPWTSGFITTDGTVLRDNQNQILNEYFALEIDTILKLGPNDPAGLYQLSILSDDGSVVETRANANSPWQVLINNDGNHPTRLGCHLSGINLNANSRVPLRIRYYQGPRTHIALSLLWRLVPAGQESQPPAEANCGRTGNDLYFGNVLQGPANLTDYEYGKMVQRGWKAIDSGNFILDETLQPAPGVTPGQ